MPRFHAYFAPGVGVRLKPHWTLNAPLTRLLLFSNFRETDVLSTTIAVNMKPTLGYPPNDKVAAALLTYQA